MDHTSTLPADHDEVWEVLTSPDGVESWLGEGSELTPLEGGDLDVADVETGVRRHGRVDTVEPGRRLGFVWWPADTDPDVDGTASRVDVVLTPDGDRTHLTVTEVPLGGPSAVTASVAHGAPWCWRLAAVEVAQMRATLALH